MSWAWRVDLLELRSSAADAALGAALDAYSAPLAVPGAPPEQGVYSTAADRAKEANREFVAVAQEYGWLPEGAKAHYFAGVTYQELGQNGIGEDGVERPRRNPGTAILPIWPSWRLPAFITRPPATTRLSISITRSSPSLRRRFQPAWRSSILPISMSRKASRTRRARFGPRSGTRIRTALQVRSPHKSWRATVRPRNSRRPGTRRNWA